VLWIPKLSGHPKLDCDPLMLGIYTINARSIMNMASEREREGVG